MKECNFFFFWQVSGRLFCLRRGIFQFDASFVKDFSFGEFKTQPVSHIGKIFSKQPNRLTHYPQSTADIGRQGWHIDLKGPLFGFQVE